MEKYVEITTYNRRSDSSSTRKIMVSDISQVRKDMMHGRFTIFVRGNSRIADPVFVEYDGNLEQVYRAFVNDPDTDFMTLNEFVPDRR